MKLHEYEAMDIFERYGIPVPRRDVVSTVHDALHVAEKIGYPVVVKAQVLVGGRGLAGGVKIASSPEELEEVAEQLFFSEVKGMPVRKLIVCEKIHIAKELYLGITIDGYAGRPLIMVSTEGGMLIEETAKTAPEKIASMHVDLAEGFYPYQARTLLHRVGVPHELLASWSDIISRLFKISVNYEALICEINPLVIQQNGRLMAVDAKLEVDDSAISRIPFPLPDSLDRMENPIERRGKEIGVSYVELDGDVGLISSGAGLGMAAMDIIAKKMKPANFLETGGGITADQLYKCMKLVMMKPGLRGIYICAFGGINPIVEAAKGVARYMKERNVKIPVVAKVLGNHQEEAWEIFRSAGVYVVTEAATEKAMGCLFELVERGEK